MNPRTALRGLVAVAALASWPRDAAAGMGFGNSPPAIDGVTVSPSPIPAGSTATIACAAHDTDAGSVVSLVVTVSGGTLPNGASSQALAITPANAVSGSIVWGTPAPGNYTVTCTATDGDPVFGSGATATASITVTTVTANPPAIDALRGPTGPVLAGSSASFAVTAHSADGSALSYAWTATAGTISASGATATWTAPAQSGSATVSVTATDGAGQTATASAVVTVVLDLYQGPLSVPLTLPYRIASGPDGRLYVVDVRGGQLLLLTPRGDVMGAAALPGAARSVAVAPAGVFVALTDGRVARVDPASGRVVSTFSSGFANGASGLTWEATRGVLWAAEYEAGEVRAYRADGTLVVRATSAGGVRLDGVVDVAADEVHGLVWATLVTHENGNLVQGFDLDGNYRTSMVTFGSGPAQVTRAGGIAVDAAGRIYVSDVFQGQVQVVTAAGAPVGTIGTWGFGSGQLRQPAGLAFLSNGDLAVANMDAGRIERFGSGAPLPTCQVGGRPDTDCDGLPDWWELKYGLNPYWAGDALLALAADGLTNLQEFALGLDPRAPPKPILVASAPAESDPGLVRISSSVQGNGPCSVAWRQVNGPRVILLGAGSGTPAFVARTAATYAIQGVATCGAGVSDPAIVAVRIREVPPRPDPGRLQVVRNARPFTLDGRFSSDANGGALSLAWDETLGRPISGGGAGATLTATSREPGYFEFQLTAKDPAGLSASAEVPVLVVDAESLVPTAVATTPVVAQAGDVIRLDATGSMIRGEEREELRFAWSQVAGASVTLAGSRTPTPSFVAPSAGHYAFDVWLSREEGQRSPPARVDVYVADKGGTLPTVVVDRVDPPAVNQPVALRASAGATGGGAPAVRWRQVSGPAAGLTDVDRPVATVVPFDPGAYAFEATAQQGAAESLPARVAFTASAAGITLPVAIARGPATALTGERVRLDGSRSTGAAGYRWTQVAGPWVALDDAAAAMPSFHARAAGAYVFELEVDDGAPSGPVRSAPATVGVLVFSRGGEDGDRP